MHEFKKQLFSSEVSYHSFGYQDDSTHLHPKNIFSMMPFEESPLGGLALKQVCAHSHLSTGDIRPEALAYPSKREVTALKETAERWFVRRFALLQMWQRQILTKGENYLPTVVSGAK